MKVQVHRVLAALGTILLLGGAARSQAPVSEFFCTGCEDKSNSESDIPGECPPGMDLFIQIVMDVGACGDNFDPPPFCLSEPCKAYVSFGVVGGSSAGNDVTFCSKLTWGLGGGIPGQGVMRCGHIQVQGSSGGDAFIEPVACGTRIDYTLSHPCGASAKGFAECTKCISLI